MTWSRVIGCSSLAGAEDMTAIRHVIVGHEKVSGEGLIVKIVEQEVRSIREHPGIFDQFFRELPFTCKAAHIRIFKSCLKGIINIMDVRNSHVSRIGFYGRRVPVEVVAQRRQDLICLPEACKPLAGI